MSRWNPSRCAGVVAAACTSGKRTQHGKPHSALSDEQPDAREGRSGRCGLTERPVLPMKPGNAGGGKEPQFRTEPLKSKEADGQDSELPRCTGFLRTCDAATLNTVMDSLLIG